MTGALGGLENAEFASNAAPIAVSGAVFLRKLPLSNFTHDPFLPLPLGQRVS